MQGNKNGLSPGPQTHPWSNILLLNTALGFSCCLVLVGHSGKLWLLALGGHSALRQAPVTVECVGKLCLRKPLS